MKIKTVTQKEVITEREIDTPYYFRVSDDTVGAIYSTEKAIEVIARPSYYCITKCSFPILWESKTKFRDAVEITEQEFNSVMAEVIFATAGVEVCERENVLVSPLNYQS